MIIAKKVLSLRRIKKAKKMKRLFCVIAAALVLASCGQSYEEKRRISHKRRQQLLREDSAALKVAVMPTLDCLPLFVAKERHMFDTAKVDVRLKMFTAQMDCDTAIVGGSVEGAITDLVRAERMIQQGTPLRYITSTNAYWQLYTNRTARIKTLKQLDDKMVAMTRYSATDLLADLLRDSAKIDAERLFKIQVNDVNIRLKMLLNNEIDAVLLTEPQATQARLARHYLLLDSRKISVGHLGVLAFSERALKVKKREEQLEALKRGYNKACDSLTSRGVGYYRDIVVKYCGLRASQVDSLPATIKFTHIAAPQESDVQYAQKWLKR
jgi:NitT/TauT family transport system substrate-binding protein